MIRWSRSTTLGFSATLTQPNLHGDLQLTVTKPDGTAGGSTLTIGGQCQGVLGKTSLQVGFTFTQTFGGAGNQITRTAAFSGTLAFSGGQVQWTFSATGTSINLAVGVDIKLGGVQLDARLNLPMDGGQTDGVVTGVTFLLGVSLLIRCRAVPAIIRSPFFTRSVIKGNGSTCWPGSKRNRHFCAIAAIRITPSIQAKRSPMQTRAPPPNGK